MGICTGADLDHDGLSYIADWPDGTANHPSPLIIGNVLNDGMGPVSFSGGSYQAAYGTIFFQPATVAGAFYPFFSQAGTGHACVFNFGNGIPGTRPVTVPTRMQSQAIQSNTSTPTRDPANDLETKKYLLELKKVEIEGQKAKDTRSAEKWTALAIFVPLILGFGSLYLPGSKRH